MLARLASTMRVPLRAVAQQPIFETVGQQPTFKRLLCAAPKPQLTTKVVTNAVCKSGGDLGGDVTHAKLAVGRDSFHSGVATYLFLNAFTLIHDAGRQGLSLRDSILSKDFCEGLFAPSASSASIFYRPLRAMEDALHTVVSPLCAVPRQEPLLMGLSHTFSFWTVQALYMWVSASRHPGILRGPYPGPVPSPVLNRIVKCLLSFSAVHALPELCVYAGFILLPALAAAAMPIGFLLSTMAINYSTEDH